MRTLICLCFILCLNPAVRAGHNFTVVDIQFSCHDGLPARAMSTTVPELVAYDSFGEAKWALARIVIQPGGGFDIMKVWTANFISLKANDETFFPTIWTGQSMPTGEALRSMKPDEKGNYVLPFAFKIPGDLQSAVLTVEGRAQTLRIPDSTATPGSLAVNPTVEAELLGWQRLDEWQQEVELNGHQLTETLSHPAGKLLQVHLGLNPTETSKVGFVGTRDLSLLVNGCTIPPIASFKVGRKAARISQSVNLTLNNTKDAGNQAILIYPLGNVTGNVGLTYKGIKITDIDLAQPLGRDEIQKQTEILLTAREDAP
ncbi:MAG: hypothetical protein AAF492_01235 [Verrucomicrobiota bacterium]